MPGGFGPGFWSESPNHSALVGNGDSGGPVLAGSSGSGLNGIGMITIIDLNTEVPCRGVPSDSTRSCAWRTFSTTLFDVLVQTSLILQTVP